MTKDIVILDLFSGIGGFSKGLSDAGFNIITHYFSEIDRHAIAVYKHQFKNAIYAGSVTTLDRKSITRPNIITFGSPCQDFSLAGQRAGMEGQKSSLIREAIRLITECRPDLFIWENVKGVFSSNSGADFWAILQAFANIGGYRLEWQLLNTAWFLPQNRERVYLIGHLAEAGGSFRGVFPIADRSELLEKSNGEKGSGSSQLCGTITSNLKRGVHAGGETYVIQKTSGQSVTHKINHTGTLQAGGANVMDKVPNVIVDTLRTHKDGEGFREAQSDLCPTIPARARTDGSGQPVIMTHLASQSIRRLTEIECELLQGFPRNWTEYGDYGGVIKKVAKSQRYKMIGNAVTVRIVEEIGKRLLNTLNYTQLTRIKESDGHENNHLHPA